MQARYRWLAISIGVMLVMLFACEENVTGYKDNPVKKWYGQVSVDGVKSILKSDGTVWSWGFNMSGTLGNGTTENSDFPVKALNLNNVISFDQSFGAEVAVDNEGNIWFWGNLWIYLGPPGVDTSVVVPFKIAQLSGARAISIYGIFIYLLRNDNTVWHIKMDWYTPQIIEGPILIDETVNVESIRKMLAVTSEGKIYHLPTKSHLQNNLTNIVAISGQLSRHVLALKMDGTVWAWGNNDLGQLGNGTYENSDFPTQVLNLNDITAVSANSVYNLALKKDGTVWFWGFEGREDSTLISRNVPIQIEGIADAVLICSGYENLAMSKNGTYWIFNVKDKIPRVVLFN
jgi:hypothetical protein